MTYFTALMYREERGKRRGTEGEQEMKKKSPVDAEFIQRPN